MTSMIRLSIAFSFGLVGCMGTMHVSSDRSQNSAAEVDAFPATIAPEMDAQVMQAATSTYGPFTDKAVKKVAVRSNWGPWHRGPNGGSRQELKAVVGVFDPQNRKCWLWNDVTFYQEHDRRITLDHAADDVNEIKCDRLRLIRSRPRPRGRSRRAACGRPIPCILQVPERRP